MMKSQKSEKIKREFFRIVFFMQKLTEEAKHSLDNKEKLKELIKTAEEHTSDLEDFNQKIPPKMELFRKEVIRIIRNSLNKLKS